MPSSSFSSSLSTLINRTTPKNDYHVTTTTNVEVKAILVRCVLSFCFVFADPNARPLFDQQDDFLRILNERKRREDAAVAMAIERTRMFLGTTAEGEQALVKESLLFSDKPDPMVRVDSVGFAGFGFGFGFF